MPRRRGSEANVEAKRAKDVRWRFAIRNPEFRKELEIVAHLLRGDREKYFERFDGLLKKWGFQYIGGEILLSLPYLHSESSQDIKFLEAYSHVVLSFPVFRRDTDNERIVQLEIDLRHPLNLLVSLVEEELSEAIEELQTGPRGRRRLDKVDFNLKVYDLAEKGESYGAIDKALKRRVSTVKSAHLAASRNIFGSAKMPRKKALPFARFDSSTHVQRCPTCQRAQKFEELCAQARLYAGQETKGQREPTGHDVTR